MKRVIDFPREWCTGDPIDQMASRIGGFTVAGILLDDGTNLWAMVFEGGYRFARTAAITNWAIEERYGGDPEPGEASAVNEAWRTLLAQLGKADREARAMGL